MIAARSFLRLVRGIVPREEEEGRRRASWTLLGRWTGPPRSWRLSSASICAALPAINAPPDTVAAAAASVAPTESSAPHGSRRGDRKRSLPSAPSRLEWHPARGDMMPPMPCSSGEHPVSRAFSRTARARGEQRRDCAICGSGHSSSFQGSSRSKLERALSWLVGDSSRRRDGEASPGGGRSSLPSREHDKTPLLERCGASPTAPGEPSRGRTALGDCEEAPRGETPPTPAAARGEATGGDTAPDKATASAASAATSRGDERLRVKPRLRGDCSPVR